MIEWLRRWLARLFCVGGLTVEIGVDDWECPRGSDHRVTVVIRGGIIGQHVRKITATLEDFRKMNNGTHARLLHTRILAYSYRVPPGSRQELSFTFRVPDNAHLASTNSDGELTAGGRISVIATPIGSLTWPRATERFSVRIHREAEALHAAMSRAGFEPCSQLPALVTGVAAFLGVPVGDWIQGSAQTDGTYVRHYTPSLALQELYESATLTAKVQFGWAYATLELHRRAHALPPHSEHLLTRSIERFSFQLPRQDLIGPEAELRPEGAATALLRITEEALIPPDDPRYTLLRPAASPVDSGATLLRAAAYAPDAAPENLLRPADTSSQPDSGP